MTILEITLDHLPGPLPRLDSHSWSWSPSLSLLCWKIARDNSSCLPVVLGHCYLPSISLIFVHTILCGCLPGSWLGMGWYYSHWLFCSFLPACDGLCQSISSDCVHSLCQFTPQRPIDIPWFLTPTFPWLPISEYEWLTCSKSFLWEEKLGGCVEVRRSLLVYSSFWRIHNTSWHTARAW